PPKQHTNLVFGRFRKILIPQYHFPIHGIPFNPKWRIEQASLGVITVSHIALEMMTRDQFMKDDGSGEVSVVAPQTHHLVFVVHGRRRISNQNIRSSEEKRRVTLPFRTQHFHSPIFISQRRNSYKVMFTQEVDRLFGKEPDQLRLFSL